MVGATMQPFCSLVISVVTNYVDLMPGNNATFYGDDLLPGYNAPSVLS